MNESEAAFVRLAFGQGFSIAKHEALPQHLRSFAIRAAEHKVNKRAGEILPANVGLRFAICENGGKPKELALALIDKYEGFAPVESRGAGIRKLVDVMGHLLEIDPNNGHSIVLYDEPETSLHADAQHAIRRCLEKIAEHAKIQVVYTTHSPAMINTYRPASIRILDRSHARDRAITSIRNQAFEGNYAKIRASLGISPSDSLLYCPITVVCEGATEIRCMQIVFDKLAELGTIDKTVFMDLMSMVHFLDGEGSSMEYMCRLAESQRSQVIVFHDGDNAKEVSEIREKHPTAQIVVLPAGTEFEEIVPRARYFEAFASLQGDKEVRVSAEDFNEWKTIVSQKNGTLFSKQVARYAHDRDVDIPSKHQVMAKSISLAEPSEINSKPFEELFGAIKACAALV